MYDIMTLWKEVFCMKKGLLLFCVLLLSFFFSCKKEEVKVTFIGKETVTYNVEKNTKLKEPLELTESTREFTGWYNEDKKWDFETSTVNEDITLEARYTDCKLSFRSDFDIHIDPIYCHKGDIIELPIVEKDDVVFLGWTINGQIKESLFSVNEEKDYIFDAKYGLISNGIVYSLQDNKGTLLEYVGSETNLIVPHTIDGVKITKVEKNALSGNDFIEQIVIEEGIEEIGDFAFEACVSLVSVTLPKSLRTISKGAFSSCIKLTTITIPEGVNTIGSGAFSYCINLTSLYLPKGIKVMEYSLFTFDSKLKIYCAESTQPIEWNGKWNATNLPVEWNYNK